MRIPPYVHSLPSFFNFLSGKGYTVGPTGSIFLKKEYFENLSTANPDPVTVSLLIHEEEHKKSMKGNSLRYFLSRKFRLNEELNAYKVQFAYLKKHNKSYDLEKIARNLSGHTYLFTTNYKTAKILIEKAWEEV